jgi:hypothetical protein
LGARTGDGVAWDGHFQGVRRVRATFCNVLQRFLSQFIKILRQIIRKVSSSSILRDGSLRKPALQTLQAAGGGGKAD